MSAFGRPLALRAPSLSFRPEPRVRPNLQLRELVLGRIVAAASSTSPQNAPRKTQRDTQDPWILQREERLRLDQVPRSLCYGRTIDAHDAGTDDDQRQRADQPRRDSTNRSPAS